MTPRPALKLPTPPADENATPYERFANLLSRLVRVPKHEIDKQRGEKNVVEKKRKPG